MRLQHKSFPVMEIKALDEGQGLLEAIVSVFNVEDLGGDRVMPGAFVDSLARRRPYGCLYHQWDRPVAKTLEAKELQPGDPILPESIRAYGGLYIKAKFNLDTQDGREAWSNLREQVLDQFSIGYSIDPGGAKKGKDGANELTKLTLFEWSPVLWGMNPDTVPLSVKDLQTKAVYLGEYAAEEMTLAALRDCCDSLFYRVIYDVLFDYDGERSSTEKVEMIDAAIQEFHQLAVTCLRAMLISADGDDGEMEAQYKDVFFVPARTAGRFETQLLALLTEVEGAKTRAEGLMTIRREQGRPLFSPERHGQLKALSEALISLVETTAPTPPLDLSLLKMQSNARRRRLLALGSGAPL